MQLIEKLHEQNHFTDAEKVLSNYVLDNISEISHMTIYELSENSFCSVATISRFCKKLNVKNFNEFKMRLVHECANSVDTDQRIELNRPFTQSDDEKTIAKKIHNLSIQTIEDCYANVDLQIIHEAAVLINDAQIVDIYANWNSLVSAMNLHSKLLWMGKNSNLESKQGYQFAKARTSNDSHVAIIISYFGTDERNIDLARILKETGTPYILITGPKLNPCCINASKVIHVTPEEENSDKIAAFSSDIAIDFVINLLYSFLFALNYDENIEMRRYNMNR